MKFQGFTNVDWEGSPYDKKSTSGGIFNIRLVVDSWYRKKKISIALSLQNVEYMVASQQLVKLSR